ncbi:MAG: prohibitin family protein [Verrucomicrobia bacterium]|nr:prohibitin family protein [Verrucomicrobiota bacterium]
MNVVIAALLFFLLLLFFWGSVFVIISSGHAGVYFSVFFGGTDVKRVRGEGFQLKFPWDTIYDYDIRLQQIPYEYSVISGDGLVMQFSVSIRCLPRRDSLGLLQKNIGPDYIQKIVIPATQQAIREVVGNNSAEKIYTTSSGILEEALDRVIEAVTGTYIIIDTVLIRGIGIPTTLKNAIEAKLAQQQNVLQYDFVIDVAKKEADRKRTEAQGIRDFQNIVTPGISENFLRWKGIEATLDLAKSSNAKVVVIGSQNGLPLILDTSSSSTAVKSNPTPLLPTPSPPAIQTPSSTSDVSASIAPTPVRDDTHLRPQPSP